MMKVILRMFCGIVFIIVSIPTMVTGLGVITLIAGFIYIIAAIKLWGQLNDKK